MFDVAADDCQTFIEGKGASVLFFDASWSSPARALETVLEGVSQWVRIGRVDIDLNPNTIKRFELVACPTCDVFVDGQRRARLVGLASRARLLECLHGVGVPQVSGVSSPLLVALELKAHRIDGLDEESSRLELSHRVSQSTAVLKLGGAHAPALAHGLAPILFSLIREVSLLTRFMARELRRAETPTVRRVGVAMALTFVAVSGDESLLGLLDDWLVLQAARLEFLEGDGQVNASLHERLATLIGVVSRVADQRDLHGVLRTLSRGSEALDALPAIDDGFQLLDDLVRQPLPSAWVPPVLPTFQRLRRDHQAYRLATRWQEPLRSLGFNGVGRIAARCVDGVTLEIVGTNARLS